jgi:tripartite-type tricarboxylate transporter receptor subunit TctC
VTRLNATAAKVLAAAETRTALEKAGIEAESMSAQRFGVMVRSEAARWTAFIRGANITPQ